MAAETERRGLHPFLTTFAIARTGSDTQVGRYCDDRDLWVFEGPGGPEPLALVSDRAGQTSTTTKINVEADDTDVGGGYELVTSTFVKAEADDVDALAAAEAFATTTRVRAESDDADLVAASLLSVTTKTDAQMERDDTAVGLEMFEPGGDRGLPALPVH